MVRVIYERLVAAQRANEGLVEPKLGYIAKKEIFTALGAPRIAKGPKGDSASIRERIKGRGAFTGEAGRHACRFLVYDLNITTDP